MLNFRFVRLSGRWFVDIPWDGDVTDLEMVAGANTLLECYQKDGIVKCGVLDDNYVIDDGKQVAHLNQISFDKNGSFYKVESELYRGDIWLCPVLKHVFGEYPKQISIMFY